VHPTNTARNRAFPPSRPGGLRLPDGCARYPLRIDPFVQQGRKLVGTGAAGDAGQGFGVALSSHGNTALVGGGGDGATFIEGAAWVFTRSGRRWPQQGSKLVGTGSNSHAGQGYSVALSGDGNTALVGGAYGNRGTAAGAAWVFVR
jgi:FG-GAP repeat